MFWRKKPDPLFDHMMQLSSELDELDKEAGEHKSAFDRAVQLFELRAKVSRENSISKDTMLIVAANLLGILLIIRHEHVNVITSRAMNALISPRTPRP